MENQGQGFIDLLAEQFCGGVGGTQESQVDPNAYQPQPPYPHMSMPMPIPPHMSMPMPIPPQVPHSAPIHNQGPQGNEEVDEQHTDEDEQHTEEEEGASTANQTAKVLKSDIFTKHFTKGNELDALDRYVVKCNYCPSKYKWKRNGGYGTLNKHLKAKHLDKLGMMRGQTQISTSGLASSSSQSPLFTYNHERSVYALSEAICVDHLPFQFAESVGINDWVSNHLQPAYKRTTRKTIRKNVFKAYANRKKELSRFFAQNDIRVSICSDIWSDNYQSHSYMGITCHYIDDHFHMQKRVLAFRVFDGAHTASNICNIIRTILDEYRLLHRVFTISFDNASNNTASISELIQVCQPVFGNKYFHVRCSCHILNLCVQDGLTLLMPYLEPIKYVVSFIWLKKKAKSDWGRFCKSNGVKPILFSKDVGHRWNSTYKLLHQCLRYKELLASFAAQHIPGSQAIEACWDICYDIVEILQVFNDATYTFSQTYTPSAHLFVVEALNVAGAFKEGLSQPDRPDIVEGILHMKRKWLNYYKYIPDIYLVACVFDPRFKMQGLQDTLYQYYELLNLEEEHYDRNCNVDVIIERVKSLIYDLYKTYSTGGEVPSTPQLPPSSSSSRRSFLSAGSRMLQNLTKKPRFTSSHTELDTYLTTTFEFVDDFDILDWWKQHKNTYPTLARIAAQVLAVPASTVAVEQKFSQGGHILDDRRSRLAPEALEAQVCVDDWKRAEIRSQSMNYTESSDDVIEDDASQASSAGSAGSS